MSYASLGQAISFMSTVRQTVTGGQSPLMSEAERNEIVRAMRAAAILRRAAMSSRTEGTMATNDVTALNNAATWLAALRPTAGFLAPAAVLPILRSLNPTRAALVNAQFQRGAPTLAQRMDAIDPAVIAAQQAAAAARQQAADQAAAAARARQQAEAEAASARSAAQAESARRIAQMQEDRARNLAALADQLKRVQDRVQQSNRGVTSVEATPGPSDIMPSSADNAAAAKTDSTSIVPFDISVEATPPPTPLEPMAPPSPIIDGGPATPLTPMGPATPTKSFMDKLNEPGPLGVTWKVWGAGAAIAAVAGYAVTRKKSVTPNRRKKNNRRTR